MCKINKNDIKNDTCYFKSLLPLKGSYDVAKKNIMLCICVMQYVYVV